MDLSRSSRQSRLRFLVGAVLCLAAAVALAACGSSGGSSSSESNSSPSGGGESKPAASTEEGEAAGSESGVKTPAAPSGETSPTVAKLPAELKAQYTNYPTPISKSVYADFAAVKPPWKICYAESYQGNPWRVAVANELKRFAKEYEEAGLVESFTMSVSNNDIAKQSQSIRQFASEGCSIIFTVAGSTTGVNSAIQYAYGKGIPVVTQVGAVTSPDALNVESNYYVLGAEFAEAAAEASENVLMVKGINGEPIAIQENEAANKVFDEEGSNVVNEVNGNWTASDTKQAVITQLATDPSEVGSVWTTGSELANVAEAFQQSGREAPLMTGFITGDALGYWKENPENFRFQGSILPPSGTAGAAWRVGIRTLEGKGPKFNILMVPLAQVSQEELASLYRPCMKSDSVSVFPATSKDPMPESLMDAYFEAPGEEGPYDYSKTPDPCEAAE